MIFLHRILHIKKAWVLVVLFTSSSSMSACFTVTGSSWLIMSDIIVRLLRTTPSSVFSIFTWNINNISWINTAIISLCKGKCWFHKCRSAKWIEKHRYKKKLWDRILANKGKDQWLNPKTSISSAARPSPGWEWRHWFPLEPVLAQKSGVGWAEIWKIGAQQAE